ncbi:hypothetical protein BA190_24015 [Labrys sp. WJW]|uniref:hypothetical protein n=1 Tax=Labrys sp. WJW TaxID=1737983 RepID=UPI00082DD8CF|nr:hypothetical protein [Labrys sp. WJW]OCC02394.1 hypothetical protein BA190_24015 [Labrys sp. WJW]
MTKLTIRPCRVPGCTANAHGHGKFCNGHQATYRRHGAPNQKGISTVDLRPYLKLVDQRVAKNHESPLWAALDGRWHDLTVAAREIAERSQAQPRWQREAARAVIKLAEGAEARDIVRVILAMYIMEGSERRRFVDDRAFQFQLVRRVRLLSEVNVGRYHNHATGKTKRVYRDLAPRIVLCLAKWLAEFFGSAGVWMAKLEKDQNEAQQRKREDFKTALVGLQ